MWLIDLCIKLCHILKFLEKHFWGSKIQDAVSGNNFHHTIGWVLLSEQIDLYFGHIFLYFKVTSCFIIIFLSENKLDTNESCNQLRNAQIKKLIDSPGRDTNSCLPGMMDPVSGLNQHHPWLTGCPCGHFLHPGLECICKPKHCRCLHKGKRCQMQALHFQHFDWCLFLFKILVPILQNLSAETKRVAGSQGGILHWTIWFLSREPCQLPFGVTRHT